MKTHFHCAAREHPKRVYPVRRGSVKTLENENEFFSKDFPCKYNFTHSNYDRRAHPLA
jgi:hypothetical protein